jgi:hypothetical protein
MSTETGQFYASVTALRNYITDEIFRAMGLSSSGRARRLFGPLFHPPTQRFAQLAAGFDRRVAQYGLYEALQWLLPTFVRRVESRGLEHIPSTGPLIVAANHPGVCDSLVIAANINRPDLKAVATGVPFVRHLPGMARHLIYTPREAYERMQVVREAIRHLQSGGAILIFPGGNIEPDPALMPGADRSMEDWSPSLDLMLRRVPQSQVLLTIISGVLSASWLRSPLTRLRQGTQDRQRLAEFFQVMQQMVFPRSLLVSPWVSFAEPLMPGELGQGGDRQKTLEAVIARARALLAAHLSWAPSDPAQGLT